MTGCADRARASAPLREPAQERHEFLQDRLFIELALGAFQREQCQLGAGVEADLNQMTEAPVDVQCPARADNERAGSVAPIAHWQERWRKEWRLALSAVSVSWRAPILADLPRSARRARRDCDRARSSPARDRGGRACSPHPEGQARRARAEDRKADCAQGARGQNPESNSLPNPATWRPWTLVMLFRSTVTPASATTCVTCSATSICRQALPKS